RGSLSCGALREGDKTRQNADYSGEPQRPSSRQLPFFVLHSTIKLVPELAALPVCYEADGSTARLGPAYSRVESATPVVASGVDVRPRRLRSAGNVDRRLPEARDSRPIHRS